ncbi:MAG: c-type cytochrome [Solirubrobacterales bacterium]|nr:c-type cytochrome [Solirubrobacterales bacterium]
MFVLLCATASAKTSAGAALYDLDCASCHGQTLAGRSGMGPSLRGVGAGPVDFYLSTGRMPLQDPRDEPTRSPPLLNARQRSAVTSFISSFGGPPAPSADPQAGNLSAGQHLFTSDCAGCHQVVARGGLTVGADVPDLRAPSARQIAEAVRMGPYLMPRFGPRQLSQRQLDSLVRYVLWTRRPDNAGGWSIDNLGPIPEGIIAWLLGMAVLALIARLIGERTDA